MLVVCISSSLVCFFFFFQAEDGIRDGRVTGVQTCAIPISRENRDVGAESKADGSALPHLEVEMLRRGQFFEMIDWAEGSLGFEQRSSVERSQRLERDDRSSNRHPALSFCLSMIFS